MKTWFRIGAKQSGPQPPVNHSSSDTKARLLHPGRISSERFLPTGRTRGAQLSPAPPLSFQTAFLTEKSFKIECFLAKWAPTSNRHKPRKQSIKPCLTGARTYIGEMAKS